MGKGGTRFDTQSYPRQPYLLRVDEVLRHLETDQDLGLSSTQVQQCRQKYGENEIEGEGGVKSYSLLMKQVSNAMILVGPLCVQVPSGLTNASSRSLSLPWSCPMASQIILRVVSSPQS